jgi:hypothetical protein
MTTSLRAIEELLETVFFTWSVLRGYIMRTLAELESVVSQSLNRRLGGLCEMAAILEVSQLKQEFGVVEY